MPRSLFLESAKTLQQTLGDLQKFFKNLGVDEWMPVPDDSGPGYTIKFLWKGKWVPVSSRLQPTKALNIRMCYRALSMIDEMERRGVTGVVAQTIGAMDLVSTINSNDAMAEDAAILGVRVGAKAPEIKQAYRAKAQRHHPDAGGDADIFKAITRAYERLLVALGEKPSLDAG